MSRRSSRSLPTMARRARRIVGGVAVDQHVDVGFDVVEHPPHHVTFALMGLAAHDGAGARAPPRRCGRSNYCRRHRPPPPAAPRGNRRPPWRPRALRCSRAPGPPPDGQRRSHFRQQHSPLDISSLGPFLAPCTRPVRRDQRRRDEPRPTAPACDPRYTCRVTIAFLCRPSCSGECLRGRRRPL